MTLSDLITKLEQAEGPDNQLDVAIEVALHRPTPRQPECRANAAGTKVIMTYVDSRGARSTGTAWAPGYTESVDSALALIGEKLPGWRVCVDTHGGAFVEAPDGRPCYQARSLATPAISAIAALLRALQSQEPRHDG